MVSLMPVRLSVTPALLARLIEARSPIAVPPLSWSTPALTLKVPG
jgi:hypothetical protein